MKTLTLLFIVALPLALYPLNTCSASNDELEEVKDHLRHVTPLVEEGSVVIEEEIETQEKKQYQNYPFEMKPEKMYKAEYYLEDNISRLHVPEDLGKYEEMRKLIKRWERQKPDSLYRIIKDLTIVEITEQELQQRSNK